MRYAAEKCNLADSIAGLREMAAGRDDVLAEAAGIEAESWYAWRPNRNPRGRIRQAIRSSEKTLGCNPPARSSRHATWEADPRSRQGS
jgi:hypothetical protein